MKVFPDLDGLLGLADRKDADIRPGLLRALTDLYVQRLLHSREEERHYTELALRLIEVVDTATRRAVAMRLAGYRQAPAAVVERLKRDAPEPGAPIASPALSQAGLDAPDKSMASRGTMAAHAKTRPAADDLSEVFFASSAAERRLILLNLEYVATGPARPMPPSHAIEAMRRLEQAALERNHVGFIAQLERLLDLSTEQSRRIVEDQSGEPIVVAAKAMAMPAEILHRILLFLNPAIGHSVQRVYDLAHLYDEITPQAAQHLLAIWRRTGPRMQRPKYQPLLWDDSAGPRRLPAVTPRRAADQTNAQGETLRRRR
jgi:uncharacterized protein (DUF2336 family)